MVLISHGNYMNPSEIVAVTIPYSAPIKRLISDARDSALLIDATAGRKTRGVIFTASGHLVLSSLAPETIKDRVDDFQSYFKNKGRVMTNAHYG